MGNLHSSNGKFNKFIMGKGFYAALAICLAGAGAAAWVSVDKTLTSLESDPFGEAPQAQVQSAEDEPSAKAAPSPAASSQPKADPPASAVDNSSDPPVNPSSASASSLPQQDSASQTSSEPAASSASPEPSPVSPASSFLLPIDAPVMAQFSGSSLVKNVTLNDWRTHNGVDLQAPTGTPVNAAFAGTVTQVRTDPMWGTLVQVEAGSLSACYAGLEETLLVAEGDSVSQGQQLGTVGTIPCELALEPHLHFEVKEDGSYADPLSFLDSEE